MPIYPARYLEFGSDDDSIILSCDLKSAANVAAAQVAGTDLATATYSDDGVDVGASGGIRFDLSTLDYAKLDDGGHLRFSADSTALCRGLATADSRGDTISSNTYWLTFGNANTPTGSLFGRFRINVADANIFQMYQGDAQTAFYPHSGTSAGKSHLEVVVSWLGEKYSVYVDGRVVVDGVTFTPFTDMFKFIWIGSQWGTGPTSGYNIKDFHISTRPIMIPKAVDSVIAWFGDSFPNNGNNNTVGAVNYTNASQTLFSGRMVPLLEGELRKRHIGCTMLCYGYGGHTISDTGGNDLEQYRATMLANNPNYVILNAGTNDASDGSLPADFESSLDDHVDTILAHATVKHIILCTVTTTKADGDFDNAGAVAAVAAANVIIKGQVARWDAANPSDTGRVHIVDSFTNMGGENPQPVTFNGANMYIFEGLNPSSVNVNNDLHYTGYGNAREAIDVCNVLYPLL